MLETEDRVRVGESPAAGLAPPGRTRTRRGTIAAIALLLAVFAGRSWDAVQQESATYDEAAHLLAGYTSLTLHDLRLNTEHPPLWKYWAALPVAVGHLLRVDTGSDEWTRLLDHRPLQAHFIEQTVFRTAGNDADQALARAHVMMLLLGVGLGGLIAFWAWRLGGPLAALIATLVYSLDPNFLAHAPLVTNDVALSLTFCGVMFAAWRVGQRATAGRILVLASLVAVAIVVKYSALVAGPLIVLLLSLRALLDRPWVVLDRELTSRTRRVGAAFAIGACCAVVTWAGIWTCYGFRFGIAPDSAVRADLANSVHHEAIGHWRARNPEGTPTRAQIEAEPPGRLTAATLLLDREHLLPEAFLDGVLHAFAFAGHRRTLLLGHLYWDGHLAYFPVAVLVKTPVATLTAMLFAVALLVATGPWRRRAADTSAQVWTVICVVLPPAVFLVFAMRARMNIGVRHVFPIYPFLFIGVGVAAAAAFRRRPRLTAGVSAALALGLVAESLAASPDYLSYFNVVAGGAAGGFGCWATPIWTGDRG